MLFETNDWLFDAVMENAHELIKKWISSEKGDVNITNDKEQTLLIHSVKYNRDSIFKLLLDAKADINKQDKHGLTAFHFTCALDRHEMILLLLQKKANIECRDKELQTPLHIAVLNQRPFAVQTLLNVKSHLDVVNEQGRTPLESLPYLVHDPSIVNLLAKAKRKHSKARVSAIIFMGVAKKTRVIHKDLIQIIGFMIWETRNLNDWN